MYLFITSLLLGIKSEYMQLGEPTPRLQRWPLQHKSPCECKLTVYKHFYHIFCEVILSLLLSVSKSIEDVLSANTRGQQACRCCPCIYASVVPKCAASVGFALMTGEYWLIIITCSNGAIKFPSFFRYSHKVLGIADLISCPMWEIYWVNISNTFKSQSNVNCGYFWFWSSWQQQE